MRKKIASMPTRDYNREEALYNLETIVSNAMFERMNAEEIAEVVLGSILDGSIPHVKAELKGGL